MNYSISLTGKHQQFDLREVTDQMNIRMISEGVMMLKMKIYLHRKQLFYIVTHSYRFHCHFD